MRSPWTAHGFVGASAGERARTQTAGTGRMSNRGFSAQGKFAYGISSSATFRLGTILLMSQKRTKGVAATVRAPKSPSL